MSNSFEGNNEQLIELVRKHPELYNHQHARYQDAKYKNKVWNTIGAFMEEDALACKNRWKNIRDQHRKTVKKHLSSRGTAVPKYKFSEQLSFLMEYVDATDDVDQESQSSTLPATSAAHLAEAHLNEESDHNDRLDELILKNETIEPEPSAFNSATTDPLETPVPKKIPIRVIRRIKRPAWKRLSSEPVTTTTAASTDELSPRIMEILLQKLEAAQNPGPVDAFLFGIAPALKNLSPHYWNQAKSEIFSIVHKYELKMLTDPSPLVYPDRRSET
ncbi:uncharacterized protein LOC135703067 [Ochlerotatus camptorhynchus]|uniref:uncharacterized protein LOC135703067 n=1 Tax=Ochlerotatus camptorhynchus TaxID=644619 RepID=UPI0031DAE7B1